MRRRQAAGAEWRRSMNCLCEKFGWWTMITPPGGAITPAWESTGSSTAFRCFLAFGSRAYSQSFSDCRWLHKSPPGADCSRRSGRPAASCWPCNRGLNYASGSVKFSAKSGRQPKVARHWAGSARMVCEARLGVAPLAASTRKRRFSANYKPAPPITSSPHSNDRDGHAAFCINAGGQGIAIDHAWLFTLILRPPPPRT